MKLLGLNIRNFSSIGSAFIKLDDRGLVVIEGEIKTGGADSNGAGKSSIVNAILWCNYNDAGKKLASVDDVINWKAGKNCAVICIWEDEVNDILYRISRYRKDAVFKNVVTVEIIEPTPVGVYNTVTNLTKGTDSETQKVIDQILGCDKQTFEAQCFARQSNAPDIPGMTDGELKGLLERVLPFENLNEYFKTANAKFMAKKDELVVLKSKLNAATLRLDDAQDDLAEAHKLVEGWADEVRKESVEIGSRLTLLKGDWAILKDKIKPEAKIEELKARLEDDIAAFSEIEYARASGDVRSCEAFLEAELKELIEVKSNPNCPTCGEKFANLEDAIAHCELNVADARSNLIKANIKLADLKVKADEHKINKEKLAKVVDLSWRNKAAIADLLRLEADIAALEAELAATPVNPHLGAVARLQGRIDELAELSLGYQEDIGKLEAEVAILEGVVETFSPKGIRYHILETVTPRLNEATNYYLKQLTDGAYTATWSTVTKLKSGDYKEKFSIAIDGEGYKSYGSLSGGEQRKVKLACFFALQDVIASRASKSIKLWIGDEIDHALDTAGLERLIGLLHEKTSTQSTILVISHNDLSGWIPNRIKVIKEDGISKVIG